MRFMIKTDAATCVPKDCSEDDARALQSQGFDVQRINDDDSLSPLEPLAEQEPVAAPAAKVSVRASTPKASAKTAAPAKKAPAAKVSAKAVPAKKAAKKTAAKR